MLIRFCRKSLARLPDQGASLLATLAEEKHAVHLQDCLDRCTVCERGPLVAMVDAYAVQSASAEEFLAHLASLGDDDFFNV